MSRNDKFLDIFQKFENALRDKGIPSVKSYEESLETANPALSGKVRLCRVIRNYLVHENGAFFEVSEVMVNFLQDELLKLDESEIPVKKKMIPIKYAIRETDLILVAAEFMVKRDLSVIPIFSKDGDFATSVVSYKDIVKSIATGTYAKSKKVNLIMDKHKFGFIKDDVPMKDARNQLEAFNGKKIFLILNDANKVIGWIN